jgi:hypothetical protein
VRTLQHDLDIVAIAQLLASHLLNNTQVGGREQIGLSAAEIRKLIERSRHQGNDAGRSKRHGHGGRNNRRRNGRRNDRNRTHRRNDAKKRR